MKFEKIKWFFDALVLIILVYGVVALFNYHKASTQLAGISQNYDLFLKNAKKDLGKYDEEHLVFYRKSCLECQKTTPTNYAVNYLPSLGNEKYHYYNVDNYDNSFIKETLNVKYVPTEVTLSKTKTKVLTYSQNPADKKLLGFKLMDFILFSTVYALLFVVVLTILENSYYKKDYL